MQTAQFKTQFVDAILSLPEKEKIVLSLYYIEGFSFQDIARVLDLTSYEVSLIYVEAINLVFHSVRLLKH